MASTQDDGGGADFELLTDPEGAALFKEGLTKFLERQKQDPDFPAPVWLGPRGKRHIRQRLMAYVLAKRERPPDPKPAQVTVQFDGKARRAAARLGCRLVRDLSPAELAAWTAAGRPQRVQLGQYQLVPIKALQRLPARTPPAGPTPATPTKRGKRAGLAAVATT